MAETVGALILSATGIADISGIAGLGTIGGTTIFGVSAATVVGSAAIIGVSIGLQFALNNPNTPKPENGSQALKQAVPPRIMGYGRNRLAGYYMLYEAIGVPSATSYDVMALHSGRIGGAVTAYLSDDAAVLDGDLNDEVVRNVEDTFDDHRYVGIKIQLKKGAASQTALEMLTTDGRIGGIWTPQFAGNGIAHVGMVCGASVDPQIFSREYPRGLPALSLTCDCTPCWDPRDPAQDKDDELTWTVSYNPIIQMIDYIKRSDGGMGLDYETAIAPNLSDWMVEADLCDDLVDKADGTQEPRYRSNGWFQFDNSPENVINGILSTCDGWLGESGDGALAVKVGVYRAPTDDPLTEQDIFAFSLNYGYADEELVNQLDITYTEPTAKYVTVQAEPWRDEDSISLVGSVKNKPLELTWVQSSSQARRLADRAMQRLNSLMTGTFTTSLYGLKFLGHRWVPLQYPFVSGLQDCVVEIQEAQVDLLAGQIVWKFIRIQPDRIEAYDPDADEGAPPVIPSPGTGIVGMDFSLSHNSQYVALLEDI